MSLRADQVEAFFKVVNERTPPAPLAQPTSVKQTRYVLDLLPHAFEAIGMHTVSDQALKVALTSDKHLYSLREQSLFVQPAELPSRKFFRFRSMLPALHTTLVRLCTDAAGIGQHKLRIWNPFCGAGADTYALAAMARLADNATGARIATIEVIGTDVLPGALHYAETGRYEYLRDEWRAHCEKVAELFGEGSVTDEDRLPISSKHLPPGMEPFFTVSRLGEGGYVIEPSPVLRVTAKFRLLNPRRLPDLGQLGAFDLVASFSHTLLDQNARAEEYRSALAYAVRPGGYLILRETAELPRTIGGGTRGFEKTDPGVFCRCR